MQRGELHATHGFVEAEANIEEGMYETKVDKFHNVLYRKVQYSEEANKSASSSISLKEKVRWRRGSPTY